ncbi:hypothetical protein MMC28_010564 [Mycoblastus sanguinarius]|nr:hypothetical protein [Mycoblastus sanguinarius]
MDSFSQFERISSPQPPSQSHTRRQQISDRDTDHDVNPLLSNLSPESTLEALTATDAVPISKGNRQKFIQDCVASATTSERVWGIKAALAGKKIREWQAEVADWPWPAVSHDHGNGFEGGLPGNIVQGYRDRIETINDELETLEVEDLKNYVRNTHLRTDSRCSSPWEPQSSSAFTAVYEHIDDFAAIITATIVQTLPTLSRLSSLLAKWSTRLLILRQVPPFLRDLENSQESMLSAWMAIGRPEPLNAKRKPDFSRKALLEIQAVLQDQISELGRRLDTMLDLLEGSEDTLPEKWIDNMDNLESEYSDWVVNAEELVLVNEMEIGGSTKEGTRSHRTLVGSRTLSDGPSDMVNIATNIEDVGERGVRSGIERPQAPSMGEDSHPAGIADQVEPEGTDDVLGAPRHGLPEHVSQRSTCRPAPLILGNLLKNRNSTASSDAMSDTSGPGSVTPDYLSDGSSPEIRVAFLSTPVKVTSQTWSNDEAITPLEIASRPSSQVTERGDVKLPYISVSSGFTTPSSPRSRASTFVSDADVHKTLKIPDEGDQPLRLPKGHTRTRSASLQSFEVIPRSEVRKILIRRSESYSSAPSGSSRVESKNEVLPSTPVSRSFRLQSEDVNTSDGAFPMFASESIDNRPKARPSEILDRAPTDLKQEVPSPSKPPVPPKSRHRFEQVSDLGPGSTPVKMRRTQTAEPYSDKTNEPIMPSRMPVRVPARSLDDQLDARISSILTEIPEHILLTSSPKTDAKEVTRINAAPGPKTPTTRPPGIRLIRAHTSNPLPSMTLAPAQSKAPRPQNGEPEIKLYHLHQPGKEAPIKLFVRLVGEAGERVMVRIGGGWADLGEYLKEYANHHGQRSISDGRFDIQSLPSSPISTQASPSSRPVSPTSSKPSPATAPRRQQTSPEATSAPQTPASDPFRSASRTSWIEEDSPSLGLAGPKRKKTDISPRKQAWVDEMLEQAKKNGADNKNANGALGDLGKVGSTKRVFLKGKGGS